MFYIRIVSVFTVNNYKLFIIFISSSTILHCKQKRINDDCITVNPFFTY